jgi:hypothetical protein
MVATSRRNLDTTDRPIYSAGNPMNNGGNAATTSAKGSVLGLDLYVDRNVVQYNY